jgi:hypothetical protein
VRPLQGHPTNALAGSSRDLKSNFEIVLQKGFPVGVATSDALELLKSSAKVDEFGGRSVRDPFRRALPLRGRQRVPLGDLLYLVLATLAQGGELAIRWYYVGSLFGSH